MVDEFVRMVGVSRFMPYKHGMQKATKDPHTAEVSLCYCNSTIFPSQIDHFTK